MFGKVHAGKERDVNGHRVLSDCMWSIRTQNWRKLCQSPALFYRIPGAALLLPNFGY